MVRLDSHIPISTRTDSHRPHRLCTASFSDQPVRCLAAGLHGILLELYSLLSPSSPVHPSFPHRRGQRRHSAPSLSDRQQVDWVHFGARPLTRPAPPKSHSRLARLVPATSIQRKFCSMVSSRAYHVDWSLTYLSYPQIEPTDISLALPPLPPCRRDEVDLHRNGSDLSSQQYLSYKLTTYMYKWAWSSDRIPEARIAFLPPRFSSPSGTASFSSTFFWCHVCPQEPPLHRTRLSFLQSPPATPLARRLASLLQLTVVHRCWSDLPASVASKSATPALCCLELSHTSRSLTKLQSAKFEIPRAGFSHESTKDNPDRMLPGAFFEHRTLKCPDGRWWSASALTASSYCA